ncbi:MAG TPA: tRNA 2-thiouridine(34) synthase MnmA, partial [Leptospiraceae bacterium]|nr:tRNA 2-thiouridine(34) synthase MnmA [Leptospiraceae bacterium]
MSQKEKIIVAMSGGVDSAVTAGLLLEKGYDVIGVNIKTWEYEAPNCDTTKKSCCSPEDIRDARDVGLSFNIPFYVIKMEKIFGDKVIDRFISDYQNGMTPNPCVECNTFVKFGSLFEKGKVLGIDKIATGHYANIHVAENGRYAIANGVDTKKNQAYYLYGLSQENLKNTVFPLGNMTKPEVREHARRFGLSIAEKAESQEICFIPENDYRSFLKKKNVDFTPGFFKLSNGNIVG